MISGNEVIAAVVGAFVFMVLSLLIKPFVAFVAALIMLVAVLYYRRGRRTESREMADMRDRAQQNLNSQQR